MKKVIEVCTRIEGHAKVNIFLENQNDEISYVDFEISAYRGFENILLKKKLLDIPKIASRICGLCHVSQSIASCKAIENLYELEPSEQSVLLRRLLMIGELIKSHSMHFFFQSFPDLINIFNINNNRELLLPYKLIKDYPQITSNFFDLIKIGNEIDKIFGGRAIHSITLIPGGLVYTPSKKNTILSRRYFQKALTNLEFLIEKFIEFFSNQVPPTEYMLPNPIYLALHDQKTYDRYTGLLGIKKKNNKTVNFFGKNYSNYFDKDINLRGINFNLDENVLVGPLARNKIVENYGLDEIFTYLSYFNNNWKNNILFGSFIRLIEMFAEVKKGLEILDDPLLNKKEVLPSLNSIQNSDGIGYVEAPRGILLHHYHLNRENSVDQVKLFVATEINIPLINEMITKYAQKLYEKEDINSVKKKIQMIIRSFDPCVSCATH